jgi:hypothetical protein
LSLLGLFRRLYCRCRRKRIAGREIFNPVEGRLFIEKPEELEQYIQKCRSAKAPAWVSVQPYSERGQVFGLEKLFFDFDYEKDTAKAWKDASYFAESLVQYYNIVPFITFSGNKGYHVYVFLTRTVTFPTWPWTS